MVFRNFRRNFSTPFEAVIIPVAPPTLLSPKLATKSLMASLESKKPSQSVFINISPVASLNASFRVLAFPVLAACRISLIEGFFF
jgi:hypothetical protein